MALRLPWSRVSLAVCSLGVAFAALTAWGPDARACTTPAQCNDGDLCTTDACTSGACTHTAIAGCCTSVTQCNDNNVCTTDSCNVAVHMCSNVALSGCCTSDPQCNDSNVCTADVCDLATNTCGHAIVAGCCTSVVQCNDSNVCTSDACDLATNTCANTSIAGCCASAIDCYDGNVCTSDLCSSSNTCSNPPIAGCCTLDGQCNDSDVCTADSCDLSTHTCVHSAIPGCCTSGPQCNDASSCTTDACDLTTNQCTHAAIAGCCASATDCSDGNVCTADSCDAASGTCANTAIAGCCTSPSQCSDGNACTTDTCDTASHACVNTAISGCCNQDGDCSDGNACTSDTCDVSTHTCSHGSVPCCANDSDCADSDPCTLDRCDTATKACSHPRRLSCCTAAVDCVDQSACTVDACSATDTCTHVGIGGCCHSDGDCNDGDACTTDTCDVATGVCTIAWIADCCATVADCDDGNPCTTDACGGTTCAHTPIAGCVIDAGAAIDGNPGGDGGPSPDGPPAGRTVPSGCTCHAAAGAGEAPPIGAMLLAVLALVAARRRRAAAVVGAVTLVVAMIGCRARTPEGTDAPDYDAVQLIFDHDCAGSTCHIGNPAPAGDLDLTAGVSYAALVGIPSTEDPRVRVAAADPSASYLYCKLDPSCAMPQGVRMNVDGSGRPISPEAVEAIRRWIEAGAPPPPPPPDADAGDQTPPRFAGLAQATATSETSVTLTWAAAVDDVTPPSGLEYTVYQGTAPGGESFTVPVARMTGTTSTTVVGLTAGTAYYFVVRAADAAGNHDDNTIERGVTTLDQTPPAFGGVASAAAAGPGAIAVSWSSASDNVDSASQIRYRVYVGAAPGAENFAAPALTTAPGATSASLTGLGSSTTYDVVVRAVDRAGNEDGNLVERAATTLDTVAPTFAGLATATGGQNSIALTWPAASDDTTSAAQIVYLVYQASASGKETFQTPTYVTPAGATSVAVGGLGTSTTAYFVVRARDLAGNVDGNKVERSATTLATSDTTPPTFAGLASATAVDASTIDLAWTAASDNVTSSTNLVYLIYRAPFTTACGAFDFATPTYTTLAGATTFTVSGLSPGTGYCFVARARDAAGNLDTNTITRDAITASDTTPPTFAGVSSATGTSTSSVALGWTAATDDVTAATNLVYLVYVATTPGGESYATPTYTTTAGATAFTATGLAASTTYYFVVRARDAAGNLDANTVERSATTTGDTTAPSFGGATSATSTSDSAITVSWSAATDNVSASTKLVYLAYAATTSGGENFATPTATSAAGATSLVLTGLLPSTTYHVVVRAEDEAGNVDSNLVQVSAPTLADTIAPTFAGVASVTASPGAYCSLQLAWSAATDDATAPSAITYPVYRATKSGSETLATPTAIAPAGATGFTATGLLPNTTYYFVVRARDLAGNTDGNTVEKSAATPTPTVSLASQVQPIFTTNCAKSGCHTGSAPAQGLNLSSGLAYSNLVNVASSECPSTRRVAPCDPGSSYVMWKLMGSGACFSGSPMPKTGSLSSADLNTIQTWITQGAPNN